jgi:hypothetical protein
MTKNFIPPCLINFVSFDTKTNIWCTGNIVDPQCEIGVACILSTYELHIRGYFRRAPDDDHAGPKHVPINHIIL